MIHEVASIEINCPIDKVYHFISDARNRTKYDSGLIEVLQTPETPVSIGTKIVEVRRFLGRNVEMHTEVYKLEPNSLIGFRTLAGDPTNAFGTYQVSPIKEGTRLTLDFTTNPGGIMRLAAHFIALGLKRSIPEGLRNIKRVLES